MFRRVLCSLRVRLLLLVLLAVIPSLVLMLLSAVEQRRSAAAAAQRSMLGMARIVAYDQELVIEQTRALLSSLAHLPSVQSVDPTTCQDVLGGIWRGNPHLLNLGALRPDGSLLCSSDDLPLGATPGPGLTAAFQETMRGGSFAVSGYSVGKYLRVPMLMLTQPALDAQGEVRAVLFAALNLDWLDRLVARAELPRGFTLTVLDRDGVVLARHPAEAGPVERGALDPTLREKLPHGGAVGTFGAPGPDGAPWLFAATPLLSPHGHAYARVLIGTPRERAFALADRALRRNLLWLGLATVLALAAAWFAGRLFIARRVDALLSAAERLKAGERGARSGVPHGPGELERLARAFDEMVETLECRQAEAERAAEALRQSEQRFRIIFEHTALGVVWSSPPFHQVEANAACQRMIDVPPVFDMEVMRQRSDPEDFQVDLRLFSELIEGKRDHYRMEKRYIREDGATVFGILNASLVRDAAGAPVAVFALLEDVTERKQAEAALRQREEQLLQLQKMEAVGRLAGGIAHDFNNLLTAIRGNAELALLELPVQSSIRGEMEEIQRACASASSLTKQLLAFSRKQVVEPQPVDLNALVSSTGQMLRRMVGPDVELVTELTPGVGFTLAEPGQMEQVLLNLAVNARDAMPGGGTLRIRTAPVVVGGTGSPYPVSLPPGRYVLLSVQDTGTGILPELRERIFEPFFTTKPVGEGTGLGLSTVYGIVQQSAGHIWVESEVGWGTTVHVCLPEASAAAGVSPREEEDAPAPASSETVLLVDDEPAVRMLTRRVLERQGYEVLESENAEEALHRYAEHPTPIHLLLTDVVMPRMTGPELAERLLRSHPETRVIYMSGYTHDTALTESGSFQPLFLQKPFSIELLAHTVRSALDTADGNRSIVER